MNAATRIVDLLPREGLVLVEGGAAASTLLPAAVRAAGDAIGPLTFSGIVVPGVNRELWLPHDATRFDGFLMTPDLAGDPRTRFLPLTYREILARFDRIPIAAALFSVSPPDANGMCSFGPTVDFIADLWPTIPVRIAHINPSIPRTTGSTSIPRNAFDAVIEAPQPLFELDDRADDARSHAIAGHVARFIDDGATIQTGLGKLPGAVLRALRDRRDLLVHSGLIGDGVLDLIDCGAIKDGSNVTTGVAIGTQRLYDALPNSGIRFEPVRHTHDWTIIAAKPSFVAINSAIEVDLFGQAYSEVASGGWSSGTGGATDFARGAALGGGLRVVALPATTRTTSRIIIPGTARGPVTLSRTETDIVATEWGAADLRALGHAARAAALIAIADPDHRETLSRAWREGPGRF